jgi:two-component system, sensor histidine kinase and response regulator
MGLEQPYIMIVDDNARNLQVLGNLLKEQGYRVLPARSGQQALAFAVQREVEIILLDIMMPEMNGFEVCEQLKSDEKTADIPVLFISALSDTEDKLKGFEVGGVDYITKPFQREEALARVKTHLTLRRQRRELSEINASKDKFFSIIAHDLRSPFVALQLFSQNLVEDYEEMDDAERLEFFGHMRASIQSTHRLLDNLLDWARAQTGRLPFEPAATRLRYLIEENLVLFRENASSKNVELVSEIPENSPPAFVDRRTTLTVVRNLISNAIKFTKPGGTVRVVLVETGDRLEIAVIDDGVGMDEETMKNLFRIDKVSTRLGTNREKGSGLGLILCKEFVERNDGELRVESAPGEGTTFVVSLPKASDAEAKAATIEKPEAEDGIETPPAEALKSLMNFAIRGDVNSVQKAVVDGVAKGEVRDSFAEKISELTRSFAMDELTTFLEKCMNRQNG